MSQNQQLSPVQHPGVLLKEGIDAYGISQYRLGKDLHIAHSTVTGICQGRQSITVPIALKLGKYLNTSAEYWINLQRRHDIEVHRDRIAGELDAIEPAQILECAEDAALYISK
ncbi:HigA family addiction module antitoxin [Coraliomargarita sp. W4R53]